MTTQTKQISPATLGAFHKAAESLPEKLTVLELMAFFKGVMDGYNLPVEKQVGLLGDMKTGLLKTLPSTSFQQRMQ